MDKEIDCIAKCSDLIKNLNEEERFRVIKYLIERYWIWIQKDIWNIAYIEGNNSEDITLDESLNHVNHDNYPTIKDLLIKDYPKNEAEWILIYWFYSSNFWVDVFTRNNLIEKYKTTNRRTDTRIKNLSWSISACVKKDWIKSVNDKDFLITEEWKSYVAQIINWESKWSTRKKGKK